MRGIKVSSAKHNKIYTAFVYAGSGFICLLYGIYMAVSLIQGSGFFIFALSLCVIAVALVPSIFIRLLPKIINAVLFAGMYFYIISFIFLSIFVMSYTNYDEITSFADDGRYVIMVFGAKTYTNRPGYALKCRLDTAYELLERFPRSVCVVSGGQGANEKITEADSMERYLIGLGIDSDRIYKEPDSSDTVENIEFTKKLLVNENLDSLRVIGVSSNYHLRRISILSAARDFDITLVPARNSDFGSLLPNLVREYMSYVKMIVGGNKLK